MDLLVDMSVREAAAVLGLSAHRVRALASAGAIHAIKQGRDLRLSRRDVERLVANGLVGGRPYNADNAWQRLMDGDLPDEPIPVLLARLSRRGRRQLFMAHPSLLERLASDDRLLLSGHAAVGQLPMGDDRIVEAYVAVEDLDDIIGDHRLRPPERAANVILRAVPAEVDLPRKVPDVIVAIDLMESPLPRVRGVGEDALRRLLAARQVLGTETIKDTVNSALRASVQAAERRQRVDVAALKRFAEASRDLLDDDVMADAWR